MAINYELINKGGISLGTNFELLSEKPLDSRLVVPSLEGLQNYIDSAAAYEGMIVYVSSEKKHYEVKTIDGVLSYRPFGLTEAELNDIITKATTAAMEFKGAVSELPENPSKGDFYKVSGSFAIGDETTYVGDSIVYDGEQWFVIPSGDDIEDTWRPVTDVDNDATLTFVAGDKLDRTVAADGTITYKHATVDAPELLAENEQTRTYITEVETDGFGHITGYKTATENVVDTNTTYEFEGQVEESSVYFTVTSSEEEAVPETVYLDAYSKNEVNTELAKKVDKSTYEDYVAGDELRHMSTKNAAVAEATEAATKADETLFQNVLYEIGKSVEASEASMKEYADGAAEEAANTAYDNAVSYVNTSIGTATDTLTEAINGVNTALETYKTSNDEALAGVKATADAAAVKTDVETALAEKVDKVEGYSLVADTEITRLSSVDNYNDTEVRTLIGANAQAIEGLGAYVGTLPSDEAYKDITNVISYINKKAEETLSAAQGGSSETAASVKQQLDNYKSENNTKVSGLETRVEALETASETHALKTAVESLSGTFAEYVESNNAAVADRYTKAEADGKFALITDAYNDADVRNLISANAEAIATKVAQADYDAKVKTLEDAVDSLVSGSANAVSDIRINGESIVNDKVVDLSVLGYYPDAEEGSPMYGKGENLVTEYYIFDKLQELEATLGGQLSNLGSSLSTEIGVTVNQAIAEEVARSDEYADGVLVAAKAYTDEVKKGILGEGISETFDTLKEIQTWIEGDGVNATELTSAIAAEATLRSDADTALGNRITELENIDHDHSNKDVLDGITAEKVGAWDAAEGNAKSYSDNQLTTRLAAYSTTTQMTEAIAAAEASAKEEAANVAIAAKESAIDAVLGTPTDAATAGTVYGAKAYADAAVTTFNSTTVAPIAARVKAIEDAPYTTKDYVDTQDADILAQAKAYADGKEHANTTYTVEATDNALEFTVTPSEGAAQTVTLKAPVVDTGVMKVTAGKDIVVTPEEGTGEVTVAHKEFATGEYTKTPESSDKTGDVYMMTGVTVDNGHVVGASVRSLADALMGMAFVFDGGTSTVNN